jgi:hypothetical protein
VTHSVISACSFSLASSCASSIVAFSLSLAFPLLSLALIQSFGTSRVVIVGSNLLVTSSVLSSNYFLWLPLVSLPPSLILPQCSPLTIFYGCRLLHFHPRLFFRLLFLLHSSSSLPHNREFVTSRLDIGGSNLLVTRPVIYPCSVAVSSFSTRALPLVE